MTEFVAPPTNRSKIPVITVRQLIDALVQHLPTIVPVTYSLERIEAEREDKCTSFWFYGDAEPRKALVWFFDKATTSIDAKLWSDPFEILISFPAEKIRLTVKVTPREDRSIAFDRVV